MHDNRKNGSKYRDSGGTRTVQVNRPDRAWKEAFKEYVGEYISPPMSELDPMDIVIFKAVPINLYTGTTSPPLDAVATVNSMTIEAGKLVLTPSPGNYTTPHNISDQLVRFRCGQLGFQIPLFRMAEALVEASDSKYERESHDDTGDVDDTDDYVNEPDEEDDLSIGV